MITIYGLKNCDICRKARKWLDTEGLEHQFMDFRTDALEKETIAGWISTLGWEILLNRRGTTWRQLNEDDKHAVNTDKAQALMAKHPALIKRPVFEANGKVLVGFKEDVKEKLKE
jgi:arsenate reductase